MLKSASLDAYWQDRPAAYFTIVRTIGTGGGVTPRAYHTLDLNHIRNRGQQAFITLEHTGQQLPVADKADTVDVPNSNKAVDSVGEINDCSCVACQRLFEPSDIVVSFDGETYHTTCFCCGECGRMVDPTTHFLLLDNGEPLCLDCSPLCHACGERIISGHIGVLNKDFHEECIKCFHCQKVFHNLSKIYATGSEPCCAECVAPVFGSAWNQTNKGEGAERVSKPDKVTPTEPNSQDKNVDPPVHRTLPPRLESLSHAVNKLPAAMFHTLLRPSFSFPSSLSDSPSSRRRTPKLSLSSLRAILYDELGVSLLMNFCVGDSSIELILFWLDVEHFKYFDGDQDDTKLFAHHIMLKYIGYYAELPVGLPKTVEDQIVQDIQTTPFNQEIFNEAQMYVYEVIEKTILVRFLQSDDGRRYLQALVTRDIDRRHKNREASGTSSKPIKATIVNFDKRHLQTKYYVYGIKVEIGDNTFMVFRRYSEFYALHQELKATFCEVSFPPMPKKIFFGRSQTKTVAYQRMGDLHQFLQGVLGLSPEVSQSSLVKYFLTQTQSDKDDEAFNKRINPQGL